MIIFVPDACAIARIYFEELGVGIFCKYVRILLRNVQNIQKNMKEC